MMALNRINGPIQISAKLSCRRERQIPWNTHTIPQILQAANHIPLLLTTDARFESASEVFKSLVLGKQRLADDSQRSVHRGHNGLVRLSVRIGQLSGELFALVERSLGASAGGEAGYLFGVESEFPGSVVSAGGCHSGWVGVGVVL